MVTGTLIARSAVSAHVLVEGGELDAARVRDEADLAALMAFRAVEDVVEQDARVLSLRRVLELHRPGIRAPLELLEKTCRISAHSW